MAPKGWREWTGAGLVQAFIIALYAEMYGFPLTIYLLTGFLRIDIPINAETGHLWASLLGYGVVGAIIEMLVGGLFIIAGLALVIRGWREVYSANREHRLANSGLYGTIRHAQYLGIILAVFGQIIHWLADRHHGRAVSGHRVGLRATPTPRGSAHASKLREGVRKLHAAGSHVLSAA